jgi:hypothetical protein
LVKERKIRKSDWDKVEKYVTAIYDERKDSTFRKEHEGKWKEIDRQIAMNTMRRTNEKGKELPPSWHNVLELGELSKASEIITSDVMRITFPTDKVWFQPHVYLNWPTDPQTGRPKSETKKQKIADGLLRNLMSQQHQDFGFKSRFRLSVKEALHHGSFGAEIRFEREMMVKDEGRVKTVGAPVWHPYSMWNTYPDPAPSVIGTNMFYTGSMIFVDYMPLSKLKKIASGGGWMQDRLSKVEAQENKTKAGKTKDVELVKFYGDISIERSDGDIFLPNAKVIIANGKLVYYAANDLPFSPVIYSGYERQDVRDPYYTSPIIKQSPMQKFSTIMANKFADAVALKVEPPIEYDGNDPDYVANDGPSIAPGAKTPTKSMGKGMQILDIGEPSFALQALQMGLRHMQEGTGVSALRSGSTNSDRQTAFEVNKVAQGAEIRTIEFIDVVSPALRAFLYMQHELNRLYLDDYEFYNDELHTPDVVRAKKSDIQANACFEIVGAKGMLGEEQRTERTTQVTAFASQNPLFAGELKPKEILMKMYSDAGNKNPEDFVKTDTNQTPQDAAKDAQMQQMGQIIQELQKELEKAQSGIEVKMKELDLRAREAQANHQLKQGELAIRQAEAVASKDQNKAELIAQVQQERATLAEEHRKNTLDFQASMEAIRTDFQAQMTKLREEIAVREKEIEAAKQEKRERPSKAAKTES